MILSEEALIRAMMSVTGGPANSDRCFPKLLAFLRG